jgi:curli biogenesis system outer membrane secretion channel CsgG
MKKIGVCTVILALVVGVGFFAYAEPTPEEGTKSSLTPSSVYDESGLYLGYQNERLVIACASPAPPNPKSYSTPSFKIAGKALGVLPFYSDIPSVGFLVSDTVGANLIDSGCKVIERSYLASILEEHGLSQTGITESIDYRKIGKITSVDYLLVGNVEVKERSNFLMLGKFASGEQYTEISGATARIVDVTTGQVFIAVTWHKKKPTKDPVMVGED